MDYPDGVRGVIGSTPVFEAKRFNPTRSTRLLVKCEFMNPGGSIKDRIGFRMVEAALESGALAPDGVIFEATAGNTGVALAMAAAFYGVKLVCVMTEKNSPDKIALLQALGAEIVLTRSEAAPTDEDHYRNIAADLASKTPGGWFCDQFNNRVNIETHIADTGREILDQLPPDRCVVIGGIGTGGSLTGIATVLRANRDDCRIVAAEPEGSTLGQSGANLVQRGRGDRYLIEGIGGSGLPPLYRSGIVDEFIKVSNEEAFHAALHFARSEGVLVGGSSGVILAAARHVVSDPTYGEYKVIYAVLPDSGRSYLSTIFNPGWRAMNA